jgi:hypothetical protein
VLHCRSRRERNGELVWDCEAVEEGTETEWSNSCLAALSAFVVGVYRGAVNREGRHLEVNYELAARSRHSQQSLTF